MMSFPTIYSASQVQDTRWPIIETRRGREGCHDVDREKIHGAISFRRCAVGKDS